MHQVKNNNFKRYNGEVDFPWYRELSADDCLEIREQLKGSFTLKASVDEHLELLYELAGLSTMIRGQNSGDSDFSLNKVF
jgi:hypothetical protein